HEVCPRKSLYSTGRLINPQKWYVEPGELRGHIQFMKKRNFFLLSIDDLKNQDQLTNKFCLLTFDDGGVSNYNYTYRILNEEGIKGHFFVVTDDINKRRFLSVSMVKEMAKNGQHIGSHSKSHQFLKFLNDRELHDELQHSKNFIEDVTGKACESLSIPAGLMSNRVMYKAYSIGYKHIFTSEPKYIKEINRKYNSIGRWNVEQNQYHLVRLLNKDQSYFVRRKTRYLILKLIQNLLSSNFQIYQFLSMRINRIYERRSS
ncbi:polysaccharide deacetylase family protein, partial [Thermodesulfobacteriota bacterium]